MRCCGWAVLAGPILLVMASGRQAQAVQTPVLGPDSFLVAVPIRDTSEIQRELGSAIQAKSQAEHDRARAEELRVSARARMARKSGEINAIKAREKVAKDEKRSADVVALQAEKKALEREKDLIERRESLREAEIELEKKQGELAEVKRQALELEIQLAIRRLQQERADGRAGPDDARTRQVLNDLEKRTLERQRDEADKSKEVADRRKDIIKKRLEILDAQRKFAGGT
ncbi:MAG TPA: hypothetical protein VFN08_12735 [Gemmatimonadales bacterium]|nr:hypothetical protein [Gemmatimonadales bacterium]